MKLRQLIYLHEVAQQSFNISAAADALFTSQSGVSRQLQELADELGVDLFLRHGKRLVGLTEAGEEIASVAAEVIRDTRRIKTIADTHRQGKRGLLAIVATRHVADGSLHEAIMRCRTEMPTLQIEINQEDPAVAFTMLQAGSAHLGLLSEPPEQFPDLIYFPLTQWRLLLVVPKGHPLCELPAVTLEAIAEWRCCSFERSARSRQVIDETFEAAGLQSPVVFSLDSSVRILKYVETGVGIGFVGEVSFDGNRYPDLTAIKVDHLFRSLTTGLVLPRKVQLSAALRSFIEILAPGLSLAEQGND
jgi:DNA-binding transcriptional LysR family regulator